MSEPPSYPRREITEAGEIEFHLMTRADEAAVLDFARRLPTHDLLFLPRNISQPKVLSAWINEIERGDIVSLLALRDRAVVGCGTLVRDKHSWSPHVGESGWWSHWMCAGRASAGRCRRKPLRSRSVRDSKSSRCR
jgi:DNA-binding transcriptional regulator LsrR (DeoR family)